MWLKEEAKLDAINDTIIYVKNSNWEKSRSHTQIYYFQRDYKREEREPHNLSIQWHSIINTLSHPTLMMTHLLL